MRSQQWNKTFSMLKLEVLFELVIGFCSLINVHFSYYLKFISIEAKVSPNKLMKQNLRKSYEIFSTYKLQ